MTCDQAIRKALRVTMWRSFWCGFFLLPSPPAWKQLDEFWKLVHTAFGGGVNPALSSPQGQIASSDSANTNVTKRGSASMSMAEWTDRDAEKALAEHYGALTIQRSIVDGQKGYTVVHPSGSRCFHFRLASAFNEITRALGHGDDREVMVIGEPEQGNAWMVRRTETPES